MNLPGGVEEMERGTLMVKTGRLAAALVMLLALTIAPLTPIARAQMEEAPEADVVGYEDGGGSGEEIERWWGALGAVVCGAEIRLVRVAPAIGTNPYMLAAGIGGCLLAGLDVLTSN